MEKTEQQKRFEELAQSAFFPCRFTDKGEYSSIYAGVAWEWFQRGEASAREQVAQWMLARSIATGHGDTVEDLLAAIVVHCEASALERAAKVCDAQHGEPECPERAKYCAEAIRALAQEVGK